MPGLTGTVTLSPKWSILTEKWGRIKVQPHMDELFRDLGLMLENAILLEHDKMVATGALSVLSGELRDSIRHQRVAANQLSVGVFTSDALPADRLAQTLQIYAPSVLFGWDKTKPIPLGVIINRLAHWAANRFSLNSRDARASAIGLARKWASGGGREIDRDFVHRVFKKNISGFGMGGVLHPKYARQAERLEREAIKQLEQELITP